MRGVSGRQIADGLNFCLTIYPEWPPGAAQFRSICLGIDPRNIDEEGNDSRWQHRRIEVADEKRAEERIAESNRIRDKNYEARRRAAGEKTLEHMRGIFCDY